MFQFLLGLISLHCVVCLIVDTNGRVSDIKIWVEVEELRAGINQIIEGMLEMFLLNGSKPNS